MLQPTRPKYILKFSCKVFLGLETGEQSPGPAAMRREALWPHWICSCCYWLRIGEPSKRSRVAGRYECYEVKLCDAKAFQGLRNAADQFSQAKELSTGTLCGSDVCSATSELTSSLMWLDEGFFVERQHICYSDGRDNQCNKFLFLNLMQGDGLCNRTSAVISHLSDAAMKSVDNPVC